MRKIISLILVLALCLSFACTAFAAETDEEFVDSPGESGTPEETVPGTTAPDTDGSPTTGDNSAIGMWSVLMLVAAVALVAVTTIFRKQFVNQ